MDNSDNMLSVLDGFALPDADDVDRKLADDFRKRRVERTMSLTPDNRLCIFEYDREWLADGFSTSPLDLIEATFGALTLQWINEI